MGEQDRGKGGANRFFIGTPPPNPASSHVTDLGATLGWCQKHFGVRAGPVSHKENIPNNSQILGL